MHSFANTIEHFEMIAMDVDDEFSMNLGTVTLAMRSCGATVEIYTTGTLVCVYMIYGAYLILHTSHSVAHEQRLHHNTRFFELYGMAASMSDWDVASGRFGCSVFVLEHGGSAIER